jgi:two-component system nitrogen regulation response regulator GlnG
MVNTRAKRVWIVDDDASIRRVLVHALTRSGLETREFESAEAVLADDSAPSPSALITDLRMPGRSGIDLVSALAERAPDLPVIVMTAFADLDNSVEVMRAGAFEILPKPFDVDAAVALVERALERRDGQPSEASGAEKPSLIGSAPAMKELFRVIGRLASTRLEVLLTGESGTGKERIAQALHETSDRSNEPFVALNVAALPSELLESELFGHEKGAFSGADQSRAGFFEQAEGGTLFLDEIGEMPPALQARLLRVLAEGDFYRLGGREPRRTDVRLIAATNRDLSQAVADGRFREDLYHRLNVVELRVPPLRERREDIGGLLDHYLQAAAVEQRTTACRLTGDARRCLQAYDWPGNVRELVNLCRRLTALVPGHAIRRSDLPDGIVGDEQRDPAADWQQALREWGRARFAQGAEGVMSEAAQILEDNLIDEALKATGGKRAEAARRLGIGRNTLTRKRSRDEGID